MPSNQPVASTERYQLLDVLRGFALLGVLLANMVTHSGYFFLSDAGKQVLGSFELDHVVEWWEHFLIDGKFYSLFSLLFGIGFALQLNRAELRLDNFSGRFRRRLFILFLIGLVHAVFLYVGDILTVYALTGFLLLLFRKSSDKTLLRAAAVLLLLPVLQYAIFWAMQLFSEPTPSSTVPTDNSFFDQIIHTYRTGSFAEIIQLNIGGLIFGRYPDLLFTGRFFRVLAMFLIGVFIARKQLYNQLEANRPLFKKVLLYGALTGIPCNLVLAAMMTTGSYYNLEPMGIIQPIVYAYGVPALCLCYAAGITLLFTRPGWKKKLLVFAPVGQMALTNYLMQSVICVFIFMGYGGGLIASIGPAQLSLIAIAIYSAQLIYSPIWLRYFHFGPMEWVWRSLTYRRRQPFLKR